MGKLWTEQTNKELILSYNGILWGLKEKLHCRVRHFGRKDYVAPEFTPRGPGMALFEVYFKAEIEPGMLDAKKAIEGILKDRGVPEIPVLDFEVITSDQMDLMRLGWRTYKDVRLWALQFANLWQDN